MIKYTFILLFFSKTIMAITFDDTGEGPIPDGPAGCGQLGDPLAITFEVEGIYQLDTVEIDIQIMHTWVGDLIVELEAPDLTRHLLFGNTGAFEDQCYGDSSNLFGFHHFTDRASEHLYNHWWMVAANFDNDEELTNGFYRTTSMGGETNAGFHTSINEAFSGVNDPNGTWTLYVYDNSSVDTGNVSYAILYLNYVGGQISDGEAVYDIVTSGTGDALETDVNYLRHHYWVYRLGDDNREYVFPVPDHATYGDDGDQVTLTWLDVDDKGFRADLTVMIDQTGLDPNEAILTSTMKVANLKADHINISLFSFADFTVNWDKYSPGDDDNDTAQLVNNNPSHIRQTDDYSQVEFRAGGNNNYQIGNGDSFGAIFDDDTDDLTNEGGDGFGPDDIRTAFQWFSNDLSTGDSYQVQTTIAVGGITAPQPADPMVTVSDLIFANSFDPT